MAIKFIKNLIPEYNEATIDETGFDDNLTGTARLIKPDGSFNIKKKGRLAFSVYEFLLEMSWMGFFARLIVFFFFINSCFAAVIMMHGVEHIEGASYSSVTEAFFEALFFSIQTFTTVGYGFMHPNGIIMNLIASLIAFSGLLTFALATGLFFSRFSRPLAHLIYSEKLIISPNKAGEKSLQFRIVNATNNQLINAEAVVTLTWLETNGDKRNRKFQRLDLEIEKIFLFPLNWTIIHPINEQSPLYHQDLESLDMQHVEFLILIKAYDETYDKYIHSKKSYWYKDIEANKSFVTMYEMTGNETLLHIEKINDTIDAQCDK